MSLDLDLIPKISHYEHTSISKSEKSSKSIVFLIAIVLDKGNSTCNIYLRQGTVRPFCLCLLNCSRHLIIPQGMQKKVGKETEEHVSETPRAPPGRVGPKLACQVGMRPYLHPRSSPGDPEMLLHHPRTGVSGGQ